MINCLNSKCGGCADNLKQQFNGIVNQLKGVSCGTDAMKECLICKSETPMTCKSGGGGGGGGD